MVEYIYFVKCPECEDEHFDFFDDAKAYALGCLTRKPIITQTEVYRNDFGECTDHTDLGTIWSWEDEMSDEEFQKPISLDCNLEDFDEYDPEADAEFLNLDNDIETIIVKPVPDTMTIKDLVENLEENEDCVECKWCEETFPKEDCRYEVSLGYLCPQCVEAIKSRGEELTFRESLEEAASSNPVYKYLTTDSKAEIVDKAKELFPNLSRFFDKGTITVGYEVPNTIPGVTSKTRSNGRIIDFNIDEIGSITVTHEISPDNIIEKPFLKVYNAAAAKTAAKEVLKALREAAKEVDKSKKPSLGVRRINDSIKDLSKNPEIAEELKDHITKIQYEIPLLDDYEEHFKTDGTGTPLSEKATKKLEQIYYDFMALPFADKARELGMVINRPADAESVIDAHIVSSWYGNGKVFFDVPIKDFSEETQKFIQSTKTSAEINETKKEVASYRLPTALIRYFNNDPLFYEHLTEALEYKPNGTTDLEYKNFTIEVQGPMRDVDDWDTKEVTDDFEYPVSNDDLASTIWEQFITEEDVPAEFGNLTALEEDDNLWQEFLKKHFEDLVEKYNKELLDYYEDEAQDYFEDHYEYDSDYDSGYDPDRMYDEYRDRMLFGEAVTSTISDFTGSKADLKKYLGYSEEDIEKYGAGPGVPEIPKGASFEGSDPNFTEDVLTYDKIQYDIEPMNPDAPAHEFKTIYGKNFEYEAEITDIIMYLWYMCLAKEDFGDQTREEVAATPKAFDEYFKKNYDKLFKKYYERLLDAFAEKAAEKFEENDILRREQERESLEVTAKLIDCPECGDTKCFDQETGICNTCGFH